MKTIKRKPVNLSSPVTFLASGQPDSPGQFNIKAYTGASIDTYYGKLVFDVSGMSARENMPILREHKRDRIVGFGQGYQDGKTFSVSGKFSTVTDDAIECRALAAEGYPWQASVGIRPTKIKTLSDKETCLVNGAELTGPAEIWLKSEVGEVSFVSLGADSDTSIHVFSETLEEVEAEHEPSSKDGSQTSKKEKRTMTRDDLMAQAPELVALLAAEGKSEGIAEERARVISILASDPDKNHIGVLKTAIEAGTPADGIFKTLYDAERNLRQTGLQSLADQASPSVGQTRDDLFANPVKTFMGEVLNLVAGGMSKAEALVKVAGDSPELHEAYIKDINKG